jgi:hypothetical protein
MRVMSPQQRQSRYNRRMKWPEALWFIRHGQSAYNVHRDHKLQDPEYREFQAQFEADCRSLRTRELAQKMWERYALHFGDWNTPLTDEGRRQARTVGAALPQAVALPDVLFVSPHDRTWQTLRALTEGWPALADVKTVEEPRLHEDRHRLQRLAHLPRPGTHPEDAVRPVGGLLVPLSPGGERPGCHRACPLVHRHPDPRLRRKEGRGHHPPPHPAVLHGRGGPLEPAAVPAPRRAPQADQLRPDHLPGQSRHR